MNISTRRRVQWPALGLQSLLHLGTFSLLPLPPWNSEGLSTWCLWWKAASLSSPTWLSSQSSLHLHLSLLHGNLTNAACQHPVVLHWFFQWVPEDRTAQAPMTPKATNSNRKPSVPHPHPHHWGMIQGKEYGFPSTCTCMQHGSKTHIWLNEIL